MIKPKSSGGRFSIAAIDQDDFDEEKKTRVDVTIPGAW